jgi:hypothetical protein
MDVHYAHMQFAVSDRVVSQKVKNLNTWAIQTVLLWIYLVPRSVPFVDAEHSGTIFCNFDSNHSLALSAGIRSITCGADFLPHSHFLAFALLHKQSNWKASITRELNDAVRCTERRRSLENVMRLRESKVHTPRSIQRYSNGDTATCPRRVFAWYHTPALLAFKLPQYTVLSLLRIHEQVWGNLSPNFWCLSM